jgi:alpha-glucosidase (family GH31 glycosyl hydrolase)
VSYNGKHILSYITTGGNLDINFFMRGSDKEIISEYQKFIVLPKLPPFWSMGLHASGNGWHHLDKVKDVVGAY